MKSSYYLRNNFMLVIGIIRIALKRFGAIEMSELALLLPMLLDDKIVKLLQNKDIEYKIRSLIMHNNLSLANYNDRYLSLLPLVYEAVSLLLDVDAIGLENGKITASKLEILDRMKEESQSERLNLISIATKRLLDIVSNDDLPQLYTVLKVEL
jgi:hypothetical protein